MQERGTTIGGVLYKMPEIFMVVATQNPIEQEGTYLLAEAQLDRFLLKEKLEYPNADEEIEILNRIENDVFINRNPVLNLNDVKYLQEICKKVYINQEVKTYIINIIQATRNVKEVLPKELAEYVELGASTRGAIAFMKSAKAVALINSRDYVTPDDIESLRYSVLRHRIGLNYSAIADEIKIENIIDAIFNEVEMP